METCTIHQTSTLNANNGLSNKRNSQRRKRRSKKKVKRESVLRPSIYQKIQQKRKSQVLNTHSQPLLRNAVSRQLPTMLPVTVPDHQRTVFISLPALFDCWRHVPPSVLFDALFVVPVHQCWLLHPEPSLVCDPGVRHIFADDKFVTLLRWKEQQGLLFCILDAVDPSAAVPASAGCYKVAPFWYKLSSALQLLYDPDSSTHYRALLLDTNWWRFAYRHMYSSKYDTTCDEVLEQLRFVSAHSYNWQAVQEILYQSNPTLHVVTSYTNRAEIAAIRSVFGLKPCGGLQSTPSLPVSAPVPKKTAAAIDMDEMHIELDPALKNYVACEMLASPSNDSCSSSSSHLLRRQHALDLMNSGSEDDMDDDLKHYDKQSSSSSYDEDDVSSSALAPVISFADVDADADPDDADDDARHSFADSQMSGMEWWVCPGYYYETHKTNQGGDDCQDAASF